MVDDPCQITREEAPHLVIDGATVPRLFLCLDDRAVGAGHAIAAEIAEIEPLPDLPPDAVDARVVRRAVRQSDRFGPNHDCGWVARRQAEPGRTVNIADGRLHGVPLIPGHRADSSDDEVW